MKRKFFLTIICTILLSNSAVFAKDANKIVVFPYFAFADSLSEEYTYVLYTVPDLIRMTLLEGNRFIVAENREIREAAAALDLHDNYYIDEDNCFKIANFLEADYYIRGYILSQDETLKVMHSIIRVDEGRTVHIDRLF